MKENKDTLKIFGIFLCLLSVAVMVVVFFLSYDHRAIRNTCEDYYSSLEFKRYDSAYNEFSDELKSQISDTEFNTESTDSAQSLIDSLGDGIKFDCKIIAQNIEENKARATVQVKTYGDDHNKTENVEFSFVKEKGKWKINSYK